ncbi:MAG: hypothetical protein F6J93_11550 [Oscillatoria sp. SIO1A7]|nr:hypothetical protein [Oscillatoria sp. SIO1A7]
MNDLLKNYSIGVEFAEASGAEHLEMMQMRDRLFEVESGLTAEEKQILAVADRQLIARAPEFYRELLRFVDLRARRQSQEIPPQRWWWYLDVIAYLPDSSIGSKALVKLQ